MTCFFPQRAHSSLGKIDTYHALYAQNVTEAQSRVTSGPRDLTCGNCKQLGNAGMG